MPNKENIGTIQHEHIINEMARVGFMGNMDVVVYTDDPGYIPHVHIIDSATRGKEFDACVMIEDNRYFTHGKHNSEFNSKLRKEFDDFMHQPCRIPQFKNNYEFAISMWNANNSNSTVIPKTDSNGETIIPDYSLIKPYKGALNIDTDDKIEVQNKNLPKSKNQIKVQEKELKEMIKESLFEILSEKGLI